MSFFRSVISANFRVNEKGETTFFFPLLAGVWCPRKGYRITSDEDVAKLKRYMGFFFGILLFGLAPPVIVVVVGFREAMGISFPVLMLLCVAIGFAYTFIFEQVAICGVVEKYEQTEERLKFRDIQRMYAASHSQLTLFVLGFLNLFFLAIGLFGILSGLAVGPGIFLVVIFSLTGAQLVHQLKLRHQGDDRP